VSGIKASIEAAGGAIAAELAPMLPGMAAENERLDRALPLAPPRSGPGRPAGARNKRTQALAAYYLGRYGDPLEGLLSLGTGDLRHTLAELRALSREAGLELGVDTVMGLLAFKRQCLEAALPYLHAKLAPTTAEGEAVVPVLAIGTLKLDADQVARAGGAINLEDLVDVSPAISEA
jgi:hypothetical protein